MVKKVLQALGHCLWGKSCYKLRQRMAAYEVSFGTEGKIINPTLHSNFEEIIWYPNKDFSGNIENKNV